MACFDFTNKLINGDKKIFNYGNFKRDFTYLDDVLDGIIKIVNLLPKEYDFQSHIELIPMQKGDVPETYADTNELEKDFGFTPKTSLKDGLREFVECLKDYYKR